jgi:hypothetical protein
MRIPVCCAHHNIWAQLQNKRISLYGPKFAYHRMGYISELLRKSNEVLGFMSDWGLPEYFSNCYRQ